MSQVQLAKRIGSSQSRVAKMEASDPSVSVDLLIKGLLATGATKQQIGKAIAEGPSKRAGLASIAGGWKGSDELGRAAVAARRRSRAAHRG